MQPTTTVLELSSRAIIIGKRIQSLSWSFHESYKKINPSLLENEPGELMAIVDLILQNEEKLGHILSSVGDLREDFKSEMRKGRL